MTAKDPTYTVKGEFTTSGVNLETYLPKPAPSDSYHFFQVHDISQSVGSSHINALLIYMKREQEDEKPLRWNNNDPLVTIPAITPSTPITGHASSPGFKWDADDSLIIVYHEPVKQDDIDDMQKTVKNIFDTVTKHGAFNTTWLLNDFESTCNPLESLEGSGSKKALEVLFFNPRKAGMTIIAKPR